MKENRLKRLFADGDVAIGSMVMEFDTTGISRIAAAAGADYLIFDQEHTGWTAERMRTLMGTCRADDVVPIVRVPDTQYHLVAQTLDTGAMGIMAPMVESAEEAELLVTSAKYPPRGRRGFGIVYSDAMEGDLVETMTSVNRELLIITQIESVAGLEALDGIAATDGVDMLFIGPYDLTISLGVPGEFTHASYLDAVQQVVNTCRKHERVAGTFVGGVDDGVRAAEQGFQCLMYANDVFLYTRALGEGVEGIRAQLKSG